MSIPSQTKPIKPTSGSSGGSGSAKYFLHDGIAFVERMDYFGDDLTVVNAARVSFAKESTVITEPDRRLIRYLARNNHITPFFHPQVRFRLKMPIFVAREWFRHTIGFARNEMSRRYVDSTPECWLPVDGIRERDAKLKQGSKSTFVEDNNKILGMMSDFQNNAVEFYENLLHLGVAPEVARSVLPQSMYTEFIETGSLYAYARLCKLRLDPHAQKEIRDYADAVAKCLQGAFPVSWEALMENTWASGPAPAPALAAPPAPAPVLAPAPAPLIPISIDTNIDGLEIMIDSSLLKTASLVHHPWGC